MRSAKNSRRRTSQALWTFPLLLTPPYHTPQTLSAYARCEKNLSKLHISRLLVAIFAIELTCYGKAFHLDTTNSAPGAMVALYIAHLGAVPLVGRLRGAAFRGG